MHKYLVYGTYGWLLLGGTMHLAIDVVSQYVRGKRIPGSETTLYFGMQASEIGAERALVNGFHVVP